MTPKQSRFIAEYLKDQNGTQSAIRAGYSKRTANEQAARLLAKASIKSEVQKRIAKIVQKCEVTAERVIAELGRLAFSDIRSLYNEDGSLKPVNEWPEEVARAVAGVDAEEIFEFKSGEKVNVGQVRKVKLWPKGHALETLARHFKLLTDKVEHSGNLTIEQLLGESRT